MDAPPTYDEAIAGKVPGGPGVKPNTGGGPGYSQYNPPMDSSQGVHSFGPPPPPINGYQNASPYPNPYPNPQMVTVTMVPTTTRTVTVIEKHSDVNHCLHCCITLLFWPWIFVWIFLCLVSE
ncbi:hypothetical protein BV898_01552 [Hypsibius exemplaris]|uniref:Uncharacterized protein n=1 Tax=Hypsibius exemplaris TaxID=2072580 RepID=A0A1W0XAQ7_HYPEX|nr:hypothetical protein BV898_01552 [Hypsibius exemplaris]